MDDNDLEQQQEQSKQEAGQKTAHVAGKAAATYFGGGLGGQAYDAASNTKVGQELEKAAGNAIQQAPLLNKASEKLNDSGLLDAADKGLDIAGAKAGKGTQVADGAQGVTDTANAASDSDKVGGGLSNVASSLSGAGNKNEDEEDNDSGDSTFVFGKGKKSTKLLIAGLMPVFGFLIIIMVVCMIIFYPLIAANNFVQGVWNGIVDFFTTDQQELEEKFYQELKDVQIDMNKKYNVCIDVNLITSTLLANRTLNQVLDQGELSEEDLENVAEDGTKVPYKKMIKQIRLLAKMQIMNKKYDLDEDYKKANGTYCSTKEEKILVDSSNFTSYRGNDAKDSSTFESIAKNDNNNNLAFFLKKVNQESNDAYYLYRPIVDSTGGCSDDYAISKIPQDKAELSVGDYTNNKDSVYYWNLVNDFVDDYYDEYLPNKSDSEKRRSEVINIVDNIYLLYEQIGPSRTCAVAYSGPSSLCPNGITVEGSGTIDFEEYVAGVVSREAYSNEGIEALKAQAVAARTYALKSTNYCKNAIGNSTNAQTFTKDINDRAREAVNSTKGEILVDSNGAIFSSQYDSFCYDDKDCPDSTRNSDGTYTVTYTKMPNGEKHTIKLSDSDQYKRITHGQGHAHGMSQLLSYQMAKEGYGYKEILTYFYSDGVEISLVLSPTTTDKGIIVQKPITEYLGLINSSVDTFNQYIYTQVNKAGIGTRGGVVAAGVSLINGFYSQTGYILPYELYPSGKYTGYGIDSAWGTNTGRTDYPLNGLDCSGFVSWAIHNGGFSYITKSAKGWGEAGTKRSWSKGMTDSSAQPGDLIYNAPPSANGTTGHIRMIVDVTSEGYVVAEASGRKNGVRITNISFTSTGSYYLVDMTNYYANATVVTDYPS